MHTEQIITLFGNVRKAATSRISNIGRQYTAFGVAIISDRNLHTFHYNVVAFGKQGDFAKPLQTAPASSWSSRLNPSQSTSPLPFVTPTFVQPIRSAARLSHPHHPSF